MSNHPVSEKIPPWLLWQRLSRLEIFESFSDDQRDAFLKAYEYEPAIRLRSFKAGDIICRKGEYELDLCFILTGAVDLIDRYGEKDQVFVAGLEAGNIYGELGAIGGLPRTLDVVAHTDCEIFYVPRHALKYLEQNNRAREILAQRYRERAVRVTVADIELFDGVSSAAVDDLIPKCEILRYELRGIPVVSQGEPGDAFYIVRDGFVQVVRDEDDGSRRVIAYLRTGEYFGEMALFETDTRWASVLTAGKCELIKIRRDDFLELCRRYPHIEASARKVIEQRFEQQRTVTPEISDLLERSGQLGVIQADALLVMDLDLCIKCDACVKACESLHGKSRLIRNGIQLGKYLVPSACRHCDDPKCMNSCPTGAIKRRLEGEIYFQYDMCIGCGNCAIACPYDNIAMIDTPIFDQAQARKSHVMNDPNFSALIQWRARCRRDRIARTTVRVQRQKSTMRKPVTVTVTGESEHCRRHSRSSATSATACRSWDACTIVRPVQRSGSIRQSCSSKPARSAPARACARPEAAAIRRLRARLKVADLTQAKSLDMRFQ